MSRWIPLLAALALTGCATAPPKVVQPSPPQALLADCLAKRPLLRQNQDLVKYIQELELALASCNVDKGLLREYLRAR
jgi:hypothetical protein